MKVIITLGEVELSADIKGNYFLLDSQTEGIVIGGKKRFVVTMEDILLNYAEVTVIKKEEQGSYIIKNTMKILD